MFCKKCGHEIDQNLIKCPYCGADVNKMKKADKKAYETQKAKKVGIDPYCRNGLIFAISGFSFLPFIGCLLGIIYSGMGLSSVKRTGQGGKGLAVAGLILSLFFTFLFTRFWDLTPQNLGYKSFR